MKQFKKTGWLLVLILAACQATSKLAINDYFGIAMPADEQRYFQIVSYSEKDGISYRNSADMNPNIYAWAEVLGKDIQIKIVNNSEERITSSYVADQFSISTRDGKEYILYKGRNTDYPVHGFITSHTSKEYFLRIPSKFWETIGMENPDSHSAEYLEDFWTGMNTNQTKGKVIKTITINLGGQITIVLKPVPGK